MLDTLFKSEECWLVKTRVPIRRFTEKEIEIGGVDEELPDSNVFVDSVLDLGAMSPLRYIREASRLPGCTMFIINDGDAYMVEHPYEDFVAQYLDWLRRMRVLFKVSNG
jgi:hypothetical protein